MRDDSGASDVTVHLVFLTVVRNPLEVRAEKFERFVVVIRQLADLRGVKRGELQRVPCAPQHNHI